MSAFSESAFTPPNTQGLRQPPARSLSQTAAIPNSGEDPSDLEAQTDVLSRKQPIPPPSERMQYRAIGLVRGKYQPSDEQFNRGLLLVEDGTSLDAVLLGQVMSLVKKHLDLEQEHLWVVYPRTREKQHSLHVQILGVWEPERLHQFQTENEEDGSANQDNPQHPLAGKPVDGYFSIRGEVIFQSQEKGFVVVKIQQSPRKTSDQPKAFKLRLEGSVPMKSPGYFWELEVQRQDNRLVILNASSVALLPPRKPPKNAPTGRGDRKPMTSRPQRSGHSKFLAAPGGAPERSDRQKPTPKPVKRYPPRPEA